MLSNSLLLSTIIYFELLYIITIYFEVKFFILLFSSIAKKILAILNRRAKSHCAPFHFRVYPLAFVRNIAKSSAAAGETGRMRRIPTKSGARAKLKAVTGRCQTRHSAERIREIGGTEGNIKPVLYAVKRSSRTVESFISLFLSRRLFHRCCSCFLNYFSCISNPASLPSSITSPRNRRVEWSPFRYPIFDYRRPHFTLH